MWPAPVHITLGAAEPAYWPNSCHDESTNRAISRCIHRRPVQMHPCSPLHSAGNRHAHNACKKPIKWSAPEHMRSLREGERLNQHGRPCLYTCECSGGGAMEHGALRIALSRQDPSAPCPHACSPLPTDNKIRLASDWANKPLSKQATQHPLRDKGAARAAASGLRPGLPPPCWQTISSTIAPFQWLPLLHT